MLSPSSFKRSSGYTINNSNLASGIWSLKKWRGDYGGPAIRINTGVAEYDIGWVTTRLFAGTVLQLSEPALDTAAIVTAMVADSSNSTTVVKIYDQTGNGNHAVQSVGAAQGEIAFKEPNQYASYSESHIEVHRMGGYGTYFGLDGSYGGGWVTSGDFAIYGGHYDITNVNMAKNGSAVVHYGARTKHEDYDSQAHYLETAPLNLGGTNLWHNVQAAAAYPQGQLWEEYYGASLGVNMETYVASGADVQVRVNHDDNASTAALFASANIPYYTNETSDILNIDAGGNSAGDASAALTYYQNNVQQFTGTVDSTMGGSAMTASTIGSAANQNNIRTVMIFPQPLSATERASYTGWRVI